MKCKTCEEYQHLPKSRSIATYVNALNTGQKWSKTTLIYYFYKTTDSSASLDSYTYRNWSDTQKSNFRTALQSWSGVSVLTFTEETTTMSNADMILLMIDDVSYDYLGHAYFPGSSQKGQVYASYNNASDKNFTVGGYDYITFVHELGHSLGLAHPHDTGGSSGIFPGVTNPYSLGTNQQNQTMYTVMSYNDIDGPLTPNTVQNYGFIKGPMAYDIQTIQTIYPGSVTKNTTNSTYVLPNTNTIGTAYESILDTSGVDTISAGNTTRNATINLNAATVDGGTLGGGAVSKLNGISGGFTIAHNVVIENATGGSGNDKITGNNASNILIGGGGSDTIVGNGGNNVIFGESGNDILIGGSGFNRLSGGSGNDTIYISNGSGGVDGGTGTDTLVVPGRRTNYSIRYSGGLYRFTDKRNKKVFNVRNVEYVIFRGEPTARGRARRKLTRRI